MSSKAVTKSVDRTSELIESISQNPRIMVSFESDKWIYKSHFGRHKLYWWSKGIVAKFPLRKHVYFHLLWKFLRGYSDSTEIPAQITFVINGYLATQDLRHTTLILWSNYDINNHPVLSKYFQLSNVITKIYNPFELAKGTPLENKTHILEQQDERVYSDGDLFRLLALHKYGGVYLDSDVILLRDFTPLLSQEFVYYWGDIAVSSLQMNGAVMHAFARSHWIYLLLSELPYMCTGGFCWGRDLYSKVYHAHNPNVTVFPCLMFDPDWYLDEEVGHAPFILFERKVETATYKLNDLYDGVFAYHWHGRFDWKVEKGSKRDQFAKIHALKIKERLPEFRPHIGHLNITL